MKLLFLQTLAGASLVALAVSAPAAAQTYPNIVGPSPEAQALIDSETVYLPQSQWRLSRSDDGCSVRRDFALGENSITLIMRRLQPGLPVQYALFGSEFSVDEPVEAGFAPGTGLARYTRLADAAIGEREGFVYAGAPFPVPQGENRADEAALATNTLHYVVQGEESDAIALRTGPINQALDALADCAAESLTDMGVDVQGIGSFLRRAKMLNHDEFRAHLTVAYPGGAAHAGRQGPVLIRAIVGPDGAVTHCHVATYLTARALRDAACDTIREHGEFEPALSFTGEPTTDHYVTRIIFYLENAF